MLTVPPYPFPGKYGLLEGQLRNVFANCSGTLFEALLDILATVLEREANDRRGVLVPSLRALSVISSLTIPRECRNRHSWSSVSQANLRYRYRPTV